MEESDTEPTETEPLVSHKQQSNPEGSKETQQLRPLATVKSDIKVTKESSSKKDTRTKKSREPLSPNLQVLQEANENEDDEDDQDAIRLMKSEDDDQQTKNEEKASLFCPIFGVKNYLNHFYEKSEVKNPTMYEDMPSTSLSDGREAIFLIKRKEGLCSSSVFRLSLMLGGIILLMGTIAFIVAASASRRAVLVGKVGGIAVVDRIAASHNAEVDALLLVGLVALTLGATVVASALISRAFCRRPEYDESFRDSLLPGYASIYEHPPFLQPTERKVPATEELTQIQPWISQSHIGFPSQQED